MTSIATRLYVWHEADSVTHREHPGGGLMVFANTLDEARQAARDAIGECDDRYCTCHRPWYMTAPPDIDLETAPTPAAVHVFPDAGCCG